jgi:hypothetical protein
VYFAGSCHHRLIYPLVWIYKYSRPRKVSNIRRSCLEHCHSSCPQFSCRKTESPPQAAAHAELCREAMKLEDSFTPSRRSCVRLPDAARGQEAPRPASPSPLAWLTAATRLREKGGAQRPPSDGKRTRRGQPTRKPSPGSHLPARDAGLRAPAWPFAVPRRARQTSPRVPRDPGFTSIRRRRRGSHQPRALPPPRPARSRCARSLVRTRTRRASGLRGRGCSPDRATRPGGRPGPPLVTGLDRRCAGEGKVGAAHGPHSQPSRAGSECAVFRCETRR